MKSATKLSQLLNQRRPKGHRWTGLLGDFDGNVTSDRPGEVYVRLRQAGAGYALGSFPVRGGIREYYNLPVTVEVDPLTGEQYVAGVDEMGVQYGLAAGNAPAPATYLENHAATHEWREEADDQLQWLHTLQIYSLRVQPTTTAQTVYVQPGVYYAAGAYRWLQSGITVDLASYYPLTSHTWVLLYIDATKAIGVVDNSALDLQDVGEAPAGTYALAAVKLTAGAAIAWLTDVVDLRFMPQNPGFPFTSLSDTPADYTGDGAHLVRVTPAEDGLEFISALDAAATGLGALTYEPTGFSRPGTLTFDNGTRMLTLTPSTYFEYYLRGTQCYYATTASVVIDDTEGLHFVMFDGTNTLVSSMTPWAFDDEACFVATVYWNGATGVVGNEQHGLVMDWATHDWMHHTIGVRYRSGLGADLSDPTAIDIASGVIYDEDIGIVIDAQTTCRVFYRDSALGAGLFNFTAEQAAYRHVVSSVVQYDNAGTLTDVTNNSYVAYWIFATNDVAVPIWSLMGQRQDTTLTAARNNNTYESLDLAALPFAEMKLLYRVILRRTSGSSGGEYIETQDLRSVSNLPAGTYVPTSHNALVDRDAADAHPAAAIATDITNFDGGLSSADTDVQTALETLDDLLAGLSGVLMLDDGANWRVELTFTNGVLTGQSIAASTAAGASWT